MNPTAAQELLDLIMLDDYVARREALRVWTRRWIATMFAEHPMPMHQIRMLEKVHGPGSAINMAKAALLERMLTGILTEQNVKAVRIEAEDKGDVRTVRLEMYVVLQEPRDVDAGANAAKAMIDMAKGGGK